MTLPQHPRCVVTGAASGLGRALALDLGRRGADLTLADIDVGGAEETASDARRAGASGVRVVRCDVSRAADVEALSASVPGVVDLVVNNAGVASAGRIGEVPLADWEWTLDVTLLGVVFGCHVFAPRLRAQGHGHVLNIASAAGLLSPGRMGPYNVAKAGVIALSETLAGELAGTRVGVTVLCPTFFQTRIAQSGRFVDAETRAAAERLVARGPSAEAMAKAALRSVERGELIAIPNTDGRWLWRIKRVSPRALRGVMWAARKYGSRS